MKKTTKKYLGFLPVVFLFLIPYVFIGLLGWEKIFFRIGSVFLLSVGVIVYLAYGGLMRYPDVNDVGNYHKKRQEEVTKKRKILGPFVRILFLGLSFGIALGFISFFEDVGSIILGKQVIEKTTGKITDVETLWGSAPLFQSVQIDGDKDIWYEYFYSFETRFPTGQECDFTYLKNSKFIVDQR